MQNASTCTQRVCFLRGRVGERDHPRKQRERADHARIELNDIIVAPRTRTSGAGEALLEETTGQKVLPQQCTSPTKAVRTVGYCNINYMVAEYILVADATNLNSAYLRLWIYSK